MRQWKTTLHRRNWVQASIVAVANRGEVGDSLAEEAIVSRAINLSVQVAIASSFLGGFDRARGVSKRQPSCQIKSRLTRIIFDLIKLFLCLAQLRFRPAGRKSLLVKVAAIPGKINCLVCCFTKSRGIAISRNYVNRS